MNLPPTGGRPQIPGALLPRPPQPEAFVAGSPGGVRHLGLVVKRVYRVGPDGSCEVADPGDQERVVGPMRLYGNPKPPYTAPVAMDDDTKAFRAATHLVVQGRAHTYGTPQVETSVSIAFRDYLREIAVRGDRTLERISDGRLRFSSPEPFETMPIDYRRAYGGFDAVALERNVSPEFEERAAARPEWQLGAQTPFHYLRNPAGVGFLIDTDDESIARAEVPNLEFPTDPLTPERLAVGAPERWVTGPVPAGFDWFHPAWFPRLAYLGCPVSLRGYEGPVAEIDWGWCASDLLQTRPFLEDLDAPVRPEYFQGASPGMVLPSLDPGETLTLRNLHPEHPLWTVRLPGLVPRFALELAPLQMTLLVPHLNAVVLRPESSEVLMTWCLSAPVDRAYRSEQLNDMRLEGAFERSS